MIFADLVAGQQVFLDANTWVYHFGRRYAGQRPDQPR